MMAKPVGKDLRRLIRDHDLSIDITGAVMASMLIALSETDAAGIPIQADQPREVGFVEAADEGKRQEVTNPLEVANDDERAFLMQVLQGLPHAGLWLLQLTAISQGKRLNPNNVRSYFMSQNSTMVNPAPILTLLDVTRNAMLQIKSDESLLAALIDQPFMEYHTNASSTPALVKTFLDSVGDKVVISDEAMAAVTEAVNHQSNLELARKIPPALVAMTHAYQKAVKRPIMNWYQGDAAAAAVDPPRYTKWVAYFTKLNEIRAALPDLSDVSDEDTLMAAVPADTYTIA